MGEEQKKPQSDFMSVIVAPRSLLDKAFWKKSSTFQFIYSMLGLVFGLACIFGGLILFFLVWSAHPAGPLKFWNLKVKSLTQHLAVFCSSWASLLFGLQDSKSRYKNKHFEPIKYKFNFLKTYARNQIPNPGRSGTLLFKNI